PGTPGVRVVRRALVEHGGGAERERAVHDVGVAGDPADVGHAPVRVVRVDVLVELGRPGHVGQVAASGVLAALGAAGGAAGVHQEQRRLGRHGDRLDHRAPVVGEEVVDEDVTALHHGGLGRVLAGEPPPDQDLVDLLALLASGLDRLVRLDLVVEQVAAAVVAVHGDEDLAARVGDAAAAGAAAEPGEHLGVHDAQPGAGQHG